MALSQLSEFLAATYSDAELRRVALVLAGGRELLARLPGEGASPESLAFQFVLLLHHRGEVDAAFFEALHRLDPSQWPHLRALAATLGIHLPNRPPGVGVASAPRLVPSHLATARRLMQIVVDPYRAGVALQERLGFGATAILEVARRMLDSSHDRLVTVRVVPHRRSLSSGRAYQAMYAAVVHQVSQVVPVEERLQATRFADDADPQAHFEEAIAEIVTGPVRRSGLIFVLILDGLGALSRESQETWGYLTGRLSREWEQLFKVVAWGGQGLQELRTVPAGEGQFSAFHLLEELVVPEYDPSDVESLMKPTGAASQAACLHHLTGGNPALVAEGLRRCQTLGREDESAMLDGLLSSAHAHRMRRELLQMTDVARRASAVAESGQGTWARRIADPIEERLYWLGLWRPRLPGGWTWAGEVARRLAKEVGSAT